MVGVVAFGLVYVLNHAEGLGAAHTTITYPWPDHKGSVDWGHISRGSRGLEGWGGARKPQGSGSPSLSGWWGGPGPSVHRQLLVLALGRWP